MPLYLLDNDEPELFPPTELAQRSPNGLLAVGGDLSPSRLLAAYSRGIFPWYSAGEPPLWWTPDPRCVLLPEAVHVSRRWARWLRSCDWQISADQAFPAVIEACAEPREEGGGTWILPAMIAAYEHLHDLGYAHSIEVHSGAELVGGLYGVNLGGAFFAESMVSKQTNGSKVALLALCRQLQKWGFGLIDVQMESTHLLTMGAENWRREHFESALSVALSKPTIAGSWGALWACRQAHELVADAPNNAAGRVGREERP